MYWGKRGVLIFRFAEANASFENACSSQPQAKLEMPTFNIFRKRKGRLGRGARNLDIVEAEACCVCLHVDQQVMSLIAQKLRGVEKIH